MKNSPSIIKLSRALMGKAWKIKPPMASGSSQQITPAIKKLAAKALIAMIATLAIAGAGLNWA